MNNINQPKVTVIVPVYNGSEHVKYAIESVMKQSYENLYLIISDNNSHDNTLDVIRSIDLSGVEHNILTSNTTLSMGAHWNKTLQHLKEDTFVKILCHDDLLEPECITKAMNTFKKNPKVVAVSSYEYIFGLTNRIRKIGEIPFVERVSGNKAIKYLLKHNWLGGPSAITFKYNKDTRELRFDSELRGALDLKFWISILKFGDLYIIPEVLYRTRSHSKQATISNDKNFISEYEQILIIQDYSISKNNFIKSSLSYIFNYPTLFQSIQKYFNAHHKKDKIRNNWKQLESANVSRIHFSIYLQLTKKLLFPLQVFFAKVSRTLKRKYLNFSSNVLNPLPSKNVITLPTGESTKVHFEAEIILASLKCRIWSPNGLQITHTKNVPHRSLISDIHNGVDQERSVNNQYFDYVKKYFPETEFSQQYAKIKKLHHSIKDNGVQKHIIVEVSNKGEFILFDGIHRVSCAKKLGYKKLPCYIKI